MGFPVYLLSLSLPSSPGGQRPSETTAFAQSCRSRRAGETVGEREREQNSPANAEKERERKKPTRF